MANQLKDVLRVEGAETGIYTSIRERQNGYTIDGSEPKKIIHKYAGGSYGTWTDDEGTLATIQREVGNSTVNDEDVVVSIAGYTGLTDQELVNDYVIAGITGINALVEEQVVLGESGGGFTQSQYLKFVDERTLKIGDTGVTGVVEVENAVHIGNLRLEDTDPAASGSDVYFCGASIHASKEAEWHFSNKAGTNKIILKPQLLQIGTSDSTQILQFANPIELSSTTPGSVQNGTIYNGGSTVGILKFYDGSRYRDVSSMTYNKNSTDQQSTTSIFNSTTETAMTTNATWTSISAGDLAVGDIIECFAAGRWGTTSAPVGTFTVTLYWNSTVLGAVAFTPEESLSTQHWEVRSVSTVRDIGVTGAISSVGGFYHNDTPTGSQSVWRMRFWNDYSDVYVDTTSTGSLSLKGQWSTASTGNSITTHSGYVQVKYMR